VYPPSFPDFVRHDINGLNRKTRRPQRIEPAQRQCSQRIEPPQKIVPPTDQTTKDDASQRIKPKRQRPQRIEPQKMTPPTDQTANDDASNGSNCKDDTPDRSNRKRPSET
jgi:hypothetical protein